MPCSDGKLIRANLVRRVTVCGYTVCADYDRYDTVLRTFKLQ